MNTARTWWYQETQVALWQWSPKRQVVATIATRMFAGEEYHEMAQSLARQRASVSSGIPVIPHSTRTDPPREPEISASAVAAFVQIAKEWELTDEEATNLLSVTNEQWKQMKRPQWSATLEESLLRRIGNIVGIYVALHMIFEDETANAWIRARNSVPLFEGLPPVQAMISGGEKKISSVRAHLDAASVGL